MRALFCLGVVYSSSTLAVSGTSAAKGSLSPVEKVSQSEMADLQSAKIAELIKRREQLKATNGSLASSSTSPLLQGSSQSNSRNKLPVMQHPSLISLGSVTDYVTSQPLLSDAIESIQLHASVNVLTPLSQFDLISSLAIDARVAELMPLQDYSLWNHLVAKDTSDKQQLASPDSTTSSPLFVDRRANILTPLTNFGFKNASEAIEYLAANDVDSSFSSPKIRLRDHQIKLRTQVLYDDNIFSSPGAGLASFVVLNDLSGSAAFQRSRTSLTLSATLSDGRYLSSSDDDYTDENFGFVLTQKFAKTQSLSFTANRQSQNEARGTGLLEGDNANAVDEPLTAISDKAVLVHNYGNNDARLRFRNTFTYNALNYDSLDQFTLEREYRQLSFDNINKYQLGAKTVLNFGASFSDIDYLFDPLEQVAVEDTLDSSSKSVLAGFEREIGRTSIGRIAFGINDRKFVDADRSSTSSSFWDAEFTWNPKSYSSISLSLGRQFLETNGIGDFIDTREHKIAWAHAWANRLSTQVNAQYTNSSFIGADREDERFDFGVKVSYKFSDRLSLIGGGRYHELLSEGTDLDFNRQVIFIESNYRL